MLKKIQNTISLIDLRILFILFLNAFKVEQQTFHHIKICLSFFFFVVVVLT